MTRFRNTSGQVLISLDFGVIGPGELVPEDYDPKKHGVLTGCEQVGRKPKDPPDDDAAGDDSDAAPDKPHGRHKTTGQDKEATE